MPRVYLSIGSNIAPAENVRSALAALRRRYGRLRVSTVFESAPVGFQGDNFYNLVVGLDTDEDPAALAAFLRALEGRHGRVRDGNRFGPRSLDLDVLLYGDIVLCSDGLELPRPEILEHAFVLRPLAEIAPAERHPLSGESYAELWRRFDQSSQPLWPLTVPLEP